MKGMYTYVVRFQVSKTWIEDGFDLTDNRALEMLANDLRYANMGSELTAKVLKAPSAERIARTHFEHRPSQREMEQEANLVQKRREDESW